MTPRQYFSCLAACSQGPVIARIRNQNSLHTFTPLRNLSLIIPRTANYRSHIEDLLMADQGITKDRISQCTVATPSQRWFLLGHKRLTQRLLEDAADRRSRLHPSRRGHIPSSDLGDADSRVARKTAHGGILLTVPLDSRKLVSSRSTSRPAHRQTP